MEGMELSPKLLKSRLAFSLASGAERGRRSGL